MNEIITNLQHLFFYFQNKMNLDHDYARFASNPKKSSEHPTSLETEAYEEPDMTDSPVSSGIFFPDGYGCEAGGRFDHNKLNNNVQGNTESECIGSDPVSTETYFFDEYGKEIGRRCESVNKVGVLDQTRGEVRNWK